MATGGSNPIGTLSSAETATGVAPGTVTIQATMAANDGTLVGSNVVTLNVTAGYSSTL
jgi:hypothetical protein